MRNDNIQRAADVIGDPYTLTNVVSRRVKQLRHGYRALIYSLEKLSLQDIALRGIAERKNTYAIATDEELQAGLPPVRPARIAPASSAFSGHNMLVGSGK